MKKFKIEKLEERIAPGALKCFKGGSSGKKHGSSGKKHGSSGKKHGSSGKHCKC